MEEPFSIFTMKCFCNKIYENAHNIIGWDPNKGKNNVDRLALVMTDASDVGTEDGKCRRGGLIWFKVRTCLYPAACRCK